MGKKLERRFLTENLGKDARKRKELIWRGQQKDTAWGAPGSWVEARRQELLSTSPFGHVKSTETIEAGRVAFNLFLYGFPAQRSWAFYFASMKLVFTCKIKLMIPTSQCYYHIPAGVVHHPRSDTLVLR